MPDPVAKRTLEGIAASYDQLADRAAQRGRKNSWRLSAGYGVDVSIDCLGTRKILDRRCPKMRKGAAAAYEEKSKKPAIEAIKPT